MAGIKNLAVMIEANIQAELDKAKSEIMAKFEKQIYDEVRARLAPIILKTEQFYRIESRDHAVIITLIDQAKPRL